MDRKRAKEAGKDGDSETEDRERPEEGFDGCDFSQVPKGPKEKTALCSDNTALSGVLCVCACV